MKIEAIRARAKMLADYWDGVNVGMMTGDELAARDCARDLLKALKVVEAATAAEVMMESAALQGVKGILAPAYADGWARAHTDLQKALRELEAE